MREYLSMLALFSVWNLLILLAIWRISVRAVAAARRDAIVQTMSLHAQTKAEPARKRAPRKTVTE